MDIYKADPFDNRSLWEELFGEETVEEMTTTGDATDKTRAMFPRVSFRDVQDAELVAECLRESIVSMGKRVANNIKTWATANKINDGVSGLGFGITVDAVILDRDSKVTKPEVMILDQCKAVGQMLELLNSVTAQIATLYVAPTGDNGKYISDLLEFHNDTSDYIDACVLCVKEMTTPKSGEQ